jgi:hypothetical protein
MKSSRIFPIGLMAALALLCIELGPKARAAISTNSPAGPAKTNSAPGELPIPLSVFDLTINPTKDPFFPLSTRQPLPQIASNAAPEFSAASFFVKGLSGSASHPLALINNRTVAPGEDAEVTTQSGKVKIHCVEIRPPSVFLRVSTQPDLIEIKLRKTAQ